MTHLANTYTIHELKKAFLSFEGRGFLQKCLNIQWIEHSSWIDWLLTKYFQLVSGFDFKWKTRGKYGHLSLNIHISRGYHRQTHTIYFLWGVESLPCTENTSFSLIIQFTQTQTEVKPYSLTLTLYNNEPKTLNEFTEGVLCITKWKTLPQDKFTINFK